MNKGAIMASDKDGCQDVRQKLRSCGELCFLDVVIYEQYSSSGIDGLSKHNFRLKFEQPEQAS
jgi:hypothetical protein